MPNGTNFSMRMDSTLKAQAERASGRSARNVLADMERVAGEADAAG